MSEIVIEEGAHRLEPLTCRRPALEIEVAGGTFRAALERRWRPAAENGAGVLRARSDFWPSRRLVGRLREISGGFTVLFRGRAAAMRGDGARAVEPDPDDERSFAVVYPWDILAVNEDALEGMEGRVAGEVSGRASIDGVLSLGEGSVLLPGVYIEGTVTIGRNCKIGPNCYIRGFTSIGDGCRVGQAVEIKNSILMSRVAIGHLSYAGDSVICPGVNFGAGTVLANFRHDGARHRSLVDGKLVDTGRVKFGAILGDGVHTGIHTAVYPGRKIWPGVALRPGAVVRNDIMAPCGG